MSAGINEEAKISYTIEMLRDLFEMVDQDRFKTLAYIISMAVIEAEDAYAKEVTKRSGKVIPLASARRQQEKCS
ncbi:hypothetical protein GCM10011491_02620 [Brucella endophytica]|uniref:Uncharacterized protein n=1 Tax=Brucella endophytica TaxID=1963359 RepID=A0A916S1F0_9HYPH|nr:hypothetical protein [Brucella endophytica]GGA78891.1 hypothetical protein GCM10011491_02620 [Brucella endophytica]